MKRKILFIILGSLLLLILIFVLWYWFFGRTRSEALPNNGQFGTGGNSSQTTGAGGSGGNGQAPLGNTAGTQNGTSGNSGGAGGSGSGVSFVYSSSTYATVIPAGVSWLGGGSAGGSGSGNGFGFNQTPINSVNTGGLSGSPTIYNTVTGADGSQVSLASSLAVIVGGCIVSYEAQKLLALPVTTADNAIQTAISPILNLFGNLIGGTQGLTPANPVFNSDFQHQNDTNTGNIGECLARTLGRLAVQQITQSTVDWINSGFDGQPAYVQDFGKFFNDVADNAAGAYIQSSDLAFLCSPFQLQVKIAIVQSYANRSSSPSCTLSDAVNNVDNFINGTEDGGWQGFLAFTTEPTNNPYGAYLYGETQLYNGIAWDQQNKTLEISPGGFLSQEQCTGPMDLTTGKNGPPCQIITPGSIFENSLETAYGKQIDTLQLGDSIDQILGALTNQLLTKILYNGLANANQSSGSDVNSGATDAASTLMTGLQTAVTSAQQYASVKQRTIADIQAAQGNLASLANCWALATSTPNASAAAVTQGTAGFNDAAAGIQALQTQVDQLNSLITAANASIAALQNMQTDLLLATTPADVTSVQTQFQTLQTSGNPKIYTSTDVTTATQDRQTVQSQMSSLNQNTAAVLNQCYAVR